VKAFIDREKVRRRGAIAHAASLGGLLVLLGSVALTLLRPDLGTLATASLFGGFAISAIGIYLANRYVRKPRPEDVLEKALKPLSDQHRLYHYLTDCDHLLLTPGGLVVLETVNLDGEFSYQGGKWKQKMSLSRAFRFVFEERLGDPLARARACGEGLRQKIGARLPDYPPPPVSALVVFVHPAARLDLDPTPLPVVVPKNLHKRLPKNQPKLPPGQHERIQELLDSAIGR
jgi:hypothetical protein